MKYKCINIIKWKWLKGDVFVLMKKEELVFYLITWKRDLKWKRLHGYKMNITFFWPNLNLDDIGVRSKKSGWEI